MRARCLLTEHESTIAQADTGEKQGAAIHNEQSSRTTAARKFIRDIAFSNLPVPFQKLQTYLWLVFLTRALGPTGFGTWSLFMVTLSTATTVSTLNCGSSLMRFLSGERSREEVSQAFSTVTAMVTAAAAIVALAFLAFSKQLASGIFHSERILGLAFLLGVVLISNSIFEEVKNVLRARRLNQAWASFCLARLLPETALVIAAAMWSRNASGACAMYAGVALCSAAAGMLYLNVGRGIHLTRPAMRLVAKYARYGLPLVPGAFASTLSLGADRYVVSHFLGLQQVGIYSVCFAISAVVFFLTGPINDVLFPELSALYDIGDWVTFSERFESVQKFVIGFAFGAAALLVAFPREILYIVAPHEFTSGGATLAVLGIQGIFMAFVLLYVVILNTRMRVWSSTMFWLLSGAAIVGLDMLLIPKVGILGAAVSQLIATAAGAFVLIGLHWELFRRTFDFGWMGKASVAFGAVGALAFVWSSKRESLGGDIFAVASGGAVFVASLFLTGYLNASDVKKLAIAFL